MRRILTFIGIVALSGIATAGPALACGGLVAPNGAVRLNQTTTLASYHEGVEHYVTAFQYAGTVDNFGSIIPLPGVPTEVERGGRWTLQRLERETHPVVPEASGGASRATAAAAAPAQVLLQTTVDALDITVLSGGGQAVIDWVRAHGYTVSADAPAMLDFYARRSPVFLAARFDATRARGQLVGDGTPVQITIPTPEPWVPLHILSLDKGSLEPVQADVYLLTDHSPALLGLDPGVAVQASEPASSSLLDDLRSDTDTGWIPPAAWLTFIRVDTAAGALVHDLAIDPSGAIRPSPVQAGYDPTSGVPGAQLAGLRPVRATLSAPALPGGGRSHPGAVIAGAALVAGCVAAFAVVTLLVGRRRAHDDLA